MALSDNPFIHLTAEQLNALEAEYLKCTTKIAAGGQSYTVNGVTFTRADLNTVAKLLGQIGLAKKVRSGAVRTITYPHFFRR